MQEEVENFRQSIFRSPLSRSNHQLAEKRVGNQTKPFYYGRDFLIERIVFPFSIFLLGMNPLPSIPAFYCYEQWSLCCCWLVSVVRSEWLFRNRWWPFFRCGFLFRIDCGNDCYRRQKCYLYVPTTLSLCVWVKYRVAILLFVTEWFDLLNDQHWTKFGGEKLELPARGDICQVGRERTQRDEIK